MRKGLLSDWEKKALEKETLDRRLKHKIEQRLTTSLDALTRDIMYIVYSRHLLNFNRKNLSKWRALRVVLDRDYKYLVDTVDRKDIKIKTLDFVTKDGKAHYYIRNRETVMCNDKTKLIGFSHLESNEDDRSLFDTVSRFMDKLDQLRIRLSLRRINQPYPKGILKKALKHGFPFPDKPEEAIPLLKIRSWIHQKELSR